MIGSAAAGTVCTIVADARTGKTLLEEGRCDQRITSASTFKIAISLMGYDAGILKDAHHPALPFKKGYADWLPIWRQTTDPSSWMKNSVVWYSQQVTQALGEARFRDYVRAFDYGNQDVSGDPGKNDGLTRSWLSSSLKISPVEQVAFLRKVVNRELPVSAYAIEMTAQLTALDVAGGWDIHGKTGAGRATKADGTPGNAQGWFVGWATKGDRTLVFARQVEDEKTEAVSPGIRTRDAMLKELPAMLDKLQAAD
nr:class D beta-lactamase [Kaistia dalseonensis]